MTSLKPLFDRDVALSLEDVYVNFAQTESGLVPIQRSGTSPVFTECTLKPMHVFLKLIRERHFEKNTHSKAFYTPYTKCQSPVQRIVRDPTVNWITPETFFYLNDIVVPKPYLFNFNRDALIDTLILAKEYGVRLNLEYSNPENFERGSIVLRELEDGNPSVLKALFAYDPTIILKCDIPAFFHLHACKGNKHSAALLLREMEKQQRPLSGQFLLFKKAFQNSPFFTKEELATLSKKNLDDFCRIANLYQSHRTLRKLHAYGVLREPIKKDTPTWITEEMDSLAVENALMSFLRDLKNQGFLVRKEIFERTHDKQKTIRKSLNLDRFSGRNYVKTAIARFGLKHIKVPDKFAVVSTDRDALHLCVERAHGVFLGKNSARIDIYAEKITRLKRFATREELSELIEILKLTCFYDELDENIMVGKNAKGEEGIWFIDTESHGFSSTNFSGTPYLTESTLSFLLRIADPKDHAWLKKTFEKHCEEQSPIKTKAEPQRGINGFEGPSRTYEFPLRDI